MTKLCVFCPRPIRGSRTTPSAAPLFLAELRVWLCEVCRYTVRRDAVVPVVNAGATESHVLSAMRLSLHTDVLPGFTEALSAKG